MSNDHDCIAPPPGDSEESIDSHDHDHKPKAKRKVVSKPIIPDPKDSHPIIRASKWIGALVVILGAIASFLAGVMKVGVMVNDLKEIQKSQAETRKDLTEIQRNLFAFQTSFHDYKEERQRQEDIQREILRNLTTAVNSIQDITEQQRQTVRTRPRVRPTTSRASTALGHISVDSFLQTLPPFPARPAPPHPLESLPPNIYQRNLQGGSSAGYGSADIDFAEDTADVALQRVEILQDVLEPETEASVPNASVPNAPVEPESSEPNEGSNLTPQEPSPDGG